MDALNSQSQALLKRHLRTLPLYRMAIFILCLALLWGGTPPIKTEANHSTPPAPQSATPVEDNRIERAATPRAFRSISLSNNPGKGNPNLNGQIILGEASDSLNPARDRLVIALGSSLTVLEPGSLRPSGQSNRVWTYQNPSHPRIRKVILHRHTDHSWQFEISSRDTRPQNQRFYLRIGNDWGGINLGTGELLLQMQPSLNFAFQSQAMIGNAGGTLQTTDASGVVIRLSVPPGALAEDTLITVTPLATSPLVAPSRALHPGVKFEPEGLQFATPATFTLDFSATGQQITNKDFIFLMTSPMTMLPLSGSANPSTKTLSALVHHFSEVQPGEGEGSFMDPAAWANAALASGENLTLEELQSLAALAAVQQQQGCEQNCIDVEMLTEKAAESIAALVAQNCPNDTASPTDDGLRRYIELDVLAQQLGADVPAIRTCMEGVLRALIEKAATEGMNNPSDATLQRLIDLWGRAEQLSFPNLVTLAKQKTEDVLRALIDRDGATAAADPSNPNLQRLLDLKAKAQQLSFPERERQALGKLAAAVRVIVARASAQCEDDEATAQAEFLRAQTWHAAVSIDPTVDPTLGQAISDAMEDCEGGGNMTVTVDPANTSITTAAFSFKNDVPRSQGGYSRTDCEYQQAKPQQESLPMSLEHQRCGATIKSALTQPRPNVLAWEVTIATSGHLPPGGIGEGGSSLAGAFHTVKLTFEEAGTLKLEFNPNWGTHPSQNQLMAWVREATFNLGYILLEFPPPPQAVTSATINIPGPGTVNLLMQVGSAYNGRGDGRLLTATFKRQ